MWKNIAALLGGAASAALLAFTGALQSASASGVVGTDPVKVALYGAAIAALVRGLNWLIAKVG